MGWDLGALTWLWKSSSHVAEQVDITRPNADDALLPAGCSHGVVCPVCMFVGLVF